MALAAALAEAVHIGPRPSTRVGSLVRQRHSPHSVYKTHRMTTVRSELPGDDAKSTAFKGSGLFGAIAKVGALAVAGPGSTLRTPQIHPPTFYGPGEVAARKETM